MQCLVVFNGQVLLYCAQDFGCEPSGRIDHLGERKHRHEGNINMLYFITLSIL